jgi:branched-chain amino acid transport system substrate-binding protein
VSRLGLALLAAAGPLVCAASARSSGAPPPQRKAGEQPLEFRGPGRDAPEPVVAEVVLGWFGPGDPDHPEFGGYWRGATLALEQENASGGYRGAPFRLEAAWSESPWKAGVLELTRLVYQRGAWAVIGGVDGTTTHLAVQLALKSYFLLLSPGSSDVTADLANVPWLFSLPPSDERLASAMATAAARGPGAPVIVAATDHDSHAALVALRRALAARRLSPLAVVELPTGDPDLSLVARGLLRAAPRVAAVLAPSRLGGRLAAALRAAGFDGTILGGAPAGRATFASAAGPAADGVQAPVWLDTRSPAWRSFADAYGRRFRGEEPDAAAAAGYDALRLAAAAIRRAGLNRPRIRDAVRALAPWQGAGGVVSWNALGRNEPAPGVEMGVWSHGRLAVGTGRSRASR